MLLLRHLPRFSLPAWLLLAGWLLLSGTATAQDSRVFVNVRLIDGTGAAPVEDAVLLVAQGRIVAVGPAATVPVPANAERIDLSGKTLLPGFINAHGHAADDTESKLAVFARYGVTTVVSLGGENAGHVALRNAQNPLAPAGARLRVAGPVQAHPNAEAAVRAIDQLKALDVDWVKARVQGGSMPEPAYRALISAAHAQGLKVAVHMYTLADTKGLLRAGVDVLAHSVRDQPVDAELLGLVQDSAACLSPTLTRDLSTYVYETRPAFFDDPFFLREASPAAMASLSAPDAQRRYASAATQGRNDLRMAQRNLRAMHEAGMRVALGTDSGAFQDRFPGYFEHLELELMAEAGLAPMDLIVAATGDAAACMDLPDLGTLEAGKWADFLVLDADPLADIRNTRSLHSVWMAGEQVPAR